MLFRSVLHARKVYEVKSTDSEADITGRYPCVSGTAGDFGFSPSYEFTTVSAFEIVVDSCFANVDLFCHVTQISDTVSAPSANRILPRS